MNDDLLVISRLVVAVPFAAAAAGSIIRPQRTVEPVLRILIAVEMLAAAGLLSHSTARGSAILALGCLLVPVVLWLIRPGDNIEALSAVMRSFALAIPVMLIIIMGGAHPGPDVAMWVSNADIVKLAAVTVVMAALAFVSVGLHRPVLRALLPSPLPPSLSIPTRSTLTGSTSTVSTPAASSALTASTPTASAPTASTLTAPTPAASTSTASTPAASTPAASTPAASTLTASTPAASSSAAPARSLAPAFIRPGPELTIGMPTYDDFDGVYFTIQALRLYHDLEDTELLVIDNYGCKQTEEFVRGWARSRYILAKDVVGTAAPKDLVFRKANGHAVLCCDSHVLFAPGTIARLKQFYRDHPDCDDLLQGPLVYDDGELMSTHFDPVWREQMWGIWATDERGYRPDGEPFEIPMQGLGVFSCRAEAWPGFHPGFRGFGGEEGYLHEKFRQAGRRCLCLPWLRWMHRFGRPKGVPYPLTVEDKLRNYLLGHAELGLDPAPVLTHFAQYLPADRINRIATQIA